MSDWKAANGRPLYGIMAEFDTSEQLIEACERTNKAGYTKVDAYTPYPIEEVWEALGHHKSKLPLLVLIGGILGCLGGFGLQYWSSVIEYPMNIGGRPLNSWVAFIPATFETTILIAAFACVLGMLALNGLPMPYHPVFNVERFVEASSDRFFLMIGTGDPKFDAEETLQFMNALGATEVNEVEV